MFSWEFSVDHINSGHRIHGAGELGSGPKKSEFFPAMAAAWDLEFGDGWLKAIEGING